MPSFYDSLKERGTIQMLPLSRETTIEIQVSKRNLPYSQYICHQECIRRFHTADTAIDILKYGNLVMEAAAAI